MEHIWNTPLCTYEKTPSGSPKGRFLGRSGEGGIRTPDTVTRIQHFQCCSFSHSDTSPGCLPPAVAGEQGARV